MSYVLKDVRRVREYQVKKGYDADHDDQYTRAELTDAAMAFVIAGDLITLENEAKEHQYAPQLLWPWKDTTFKPAEAARDNYIAAIALLVAEVERIDRIDMREYPD